MAGSLTPREREVLSLLVKGRPNKTDRGGTRFRRVRGSGTRSELHVEDDNGLIANLVRLAETTKPESARTLCAKISETPSLPVITVAGGEGKPP